VIISEAQANELTIIAIAVAFPLVGIGKLYLAQIMRRNTHTRTRIGDWLVKMFIAIGMAFICVGCAYGLSIAQMHGWVILPVWGRWLIRLSAVFTAMMSLVATIILVHSLIPLLQSPLVIDSHYTSEQADKTKWNKAETTP
jgi:NADH:ubiquinone oxidoreductase subunit 2 (subunit N)